jgi:hypothetical protein
LAGTDDELSPNVARLIRQVEARVAGAPTVTQIRELADRVIAESRRSTLTLAEIQELVAVAVGRAQQVEDEAARLAALVSGVPDERP